MSDGDVAGARITFDQLTAAKESVAELPLMEAMVLEAEGREEEALACFGRIVASTAGTTRAVALSQAHIARLARKLEREDLAEASGMAILALDPDDIDGLRALAFARRRSGDTDILMPIMRCLANATAAVEADIWIAIDTFARFQRWNEVLTLIERHEFQLDPWRMTPLRIRASIELGWQRRTLEQLRKAWEDEYIHAVEAVERLVEWGALALAAAFIEGCVSSDPWLVQARATVAAIAVRTCEAAGGQAAPLELADAIQARAILSPADEAVESGKAKAILALTAGASQLLAKDDAAGATRMLVAAVRLSPENRALLDSLADAARRANLTERYLDTLLRIWTTYRDPSALLGSARGLVESSSWDTICRVMTIAAQESGSLGLDIDALFETFREQARRKLDDYLRAGDVAAGLELVIDLSRRWSAMEWREGRVSALLRAAKRRLRSRRAGEAALIATVGLLYLELAPQDVDICRMMARLRVRQRRLGDARDLLSRIVAINPHTPDDWVMLAMVQNELGELEARDIGVARALLIAPDYVLPPALARARVRIGFA